MRFLSFMVLAVGCLGSASAVTLFNSSSNANNAATRTAWMTSAGIASTQYLEDFESIAVGTNVHNDGSYFQGGLRFTGVSNTAVVASSSADFGGSNPIGTRALRGTEGSGVRLRMDFDNGPATYVAGYDIDQGGFTLRVILQDTSVQSFSIETTDSSGNSAEFWGVHTTGDERISAIEFVGVSGAAGWGLDDIEHNAVPEPGTMLALAAGSAFLAKRRKRA